MNLLSRRVVVVCSAPGVRLPDIDEDTVLVAANGGAGVVHEAGHNVDVLATTAYLFRPDATQKDLLILRSLAGHRYPWVLVDTKDGAVGRVRQAMHDMGSQCQRVDNIPPAQRDRVIEGACGLPGMGSAADPEKRVSTGVFAACFAAAALAPRELVLCGISLSAGQHGMPDDRAARHHASADRLVLSALRERLGSVMCTTSQELHRDFQIARAA